MPVPAKAAKLFARDLLSFDQLTQACRGSAWAAVLPHETQNLCVLRQLVRAAADVEAPGSLLGSSECTIVLVADGVSFEVAKSVLSPTRLGALTSTCPSTSSTALLSATTGLPPGAHGVIGVAFYDPAIDAVFNCYVDSSASSDFAMGPWPTVFSALSGRIDCVAHVGALATIAGRWSRAVVHGARVVEPSVDWNGIADDPAAMAAAVADEIAATLDRRTRRPLLVWAHVNLDSAIHLRGYDAAVRDAVAALGEAAAHWAAQGHTVIMHSDHGLVESSDSDRARKLLALLRDPDVCRFDSGGAGRILWAYPRPGSDLLNRARAAAEDFAVVVDRDDLLAAGAIADTPIARDRLGAVVVVATGTEFPLLAPEYRFEHGAFSETEMIVPVAIWRGR
jgi:hypothetical protein